MSKIRFPQALLPVKPEGSSLLGSFLLGLVEGPYSDKLAYSQVESSVVAAVALAISSPFDPNERLEMKKGANDPKSMSLLEMALSLSNWFYPSTKIDRWPESLSGFEDLARRGRSPAMDLEYLSALLVAAGANPWPQDRSDELPQEIILAVRGGYGPLVTRLLSLPGAWSAQEVMDAEVPIRYSTDTISLWKDLSTSDHVAPAVRALLAAGARIPSKDAVGLLSRGTPEFVIAVGELANPSLDKDRSRKVTAAWKDRAVASQMSSTEAQAMSKALWGDRIVNDLSEAMLDVRKMVSVPWGQKPNGSSAMAYDFLGGKGSEHLSSRARLKAGPMAGEWSVLAAAVMSRIRQGDSNGALGWSVPLMLFCEFNSNTNKWERADCSREPWRGSLSSAMGFEWRPGIAIEGVLALGLFGQRGPQDGRDDIAAELEADIKAFEQAAGLEDVAAWGRKHMPDAARFTLHLMRRASFSADTPLACAWGSIAARDPSMLEGIANTDLGAELLLALGGYASGSPGPHHAFKAIAEALFPKVQPKDWAGATESGPRTRAALVMLLSRGLPGHVDKIDDVFARPDLIGDSEMDLVSAWIDRNESSIDVRLWRSRLDQHRMEMNTPTASSSSSKGMRL